MNKIKIIEFNPAGRGIFLHYLEWLSERQKWGWDFEIQPEFSWDMADSMSAALFAPSVAESLLPQLQVLPTTVRNLEFFDSFFYDQGSWYPRLMLYDALRLILVTLARDLEARSPAFIIGDSATARVMASVVAGLGVAQVYLVGASEEMQRQKEILQKAHLSIQFKLMDPKVLTHENLSCGISINTQDLAADKALMIDLSYFNYMKTNGYILDCNLLPIENLFLEEAGRAHLRVLWPHYLSAALTRLWLDRLKSEDGLSIKELIQSWSEFLKENYSKG